MVRAVWFAAAGLLSLAATVLLYVLVMRWFDDRGVTDWLFEHEPLQLVLGIPMLVGLPVIIFIIFDVLTLGRWDKDNRHIHFPWWR